LKTQHRIVASGVAVVAVIAVAGVVWSRCCGQIIDTKTAAARARVNFVADTLDQYHRENGRYPTSAEGLEVLVTSGLLREVPTDPWNNKLHYRYPSQRKGVPFELWSLGQDGLAGGIGDDADIVWKQ
jgi:general secretion pathway protein G